MVLARLSGTGGRQGSPGVRIGGDGDDDDDGLMARNVSDRTSAAEKLVPRRSQDLLVILGRGWFKSPGAGGSAAPSTRV